MKKLTKIISLIIAVAILLQNAIVIASVIEIGDSSLIKRGELGFYTVQYWNELKQQWMYITYSRTYYIDKDGSQRIAYCVDPELDGVGWLPGEVEEYGVTISNKITSLRLWSVYKNGYPFVSYQSLGVETEDDAYLATKQAAYFIIRNWPLSKVYNYFRAGETEINGQNLEEIHRRGQKVVDAIYKLVDIAYNGNEKMPVVSIGSIGSSKQDENEKYYSQEYELKNINAEQVLTIKQIENAPEGTYIADINGNPKTVFKEGETLKVMVPKNNIDKTYNIKVNYQITFKNYPVYYAKSQNSNSQNYVVIGDNKETINQYFGCTMLGNKSNINITKIDEETKQPISGVKFSVKYKNGENIGEFETNEEGKINIQNIKQGAIIITEELTNEKYEVNIEEKEIQLGYDTTYNLEITNKHKKGSLEIIKIDKEDNTKKLQGVEFDLLDLQGNVIKHLITDENGVAYVDEINTGNYILKEVKTNEEYRLAQDHNIIINWKEKLNLTIENERKKGNIKVVKIDKDNNAIKLQGVELEILNNNDEKVTQVITDENGEAQINDLPIGTYYIKETKTNDLYVLKEDKIEVIVNDGETSEIIIKNEKIKGQIKITKISADENKTLNLPEGTKLEGIRLNVYDENNNFIEELITNEQGIALTNRLPKGKYTIKEIETNKWYILSTDIYETNIENDGEIVELEIANNSKNPQIDITKTGPNMAYENQEIKYNFDIKNTGNVELEDFTWYDSLPYNYSKITKISTGTYNQEISYNVYYKTNKKDSYMVLEQNLNSKENNYLDLTKIYLENDEKITEIKFLYGTVGINFACEEKPSIYVKLNDKLEEGQEIENETILEGYHQRYKVCDEDKVKTIIQIKKPEVKKLPRTGF